MELPAVLSTQGPAPEDVCPQIRQFVGAWALPYLGTRQYAGYEQYVLPIVPLMANTRGSAALERRRLAAVMDWALREQLVAWLRLHEQRTVLAASVRASLREWGARLRQGAPVSLDDAKLLDTYAAWVTEARKLLGAPIKGYAWERNVILLGVPLSALAHCVMGPDPKVQACAEAIVLACIQLSDEALDAEDVDESVLRQTADGIRDSAQRCVQRLCAMRCDEAS